MSVGWDCLWTVAPIGLLFIPQMVYDYGAMVNDNDRRTEEFGENPAPVPLCAPQILHGLTQVWTQTSAVRS
jgi:hypothetical protein